MPQQIMSTESLAPAMTVPDNALLEIESIHTFINQFHILEGVSLRVPAGSITALLGRNGAGKTTTLRSIMGMTPPREGRIRFAGMDIQGKTTYQIAALGIGYVPEYRAIFRDLTVEENLRIAERAKGDLARKSDLIFELFPDLKRFYKLPGGQLSGGQQQMLAIARALVPENRLLLVDEPSEGLAPIVIEAIVAALRLLAKHATILLVEQNFRMASMLADRYYILDDGHSVHSGQMADLVKDRALISQFLGAGYAGTGVQRAARQESGAGPDSAPSEKTGAIG
jgi:branched-chain amino acid transport system ATP-binding protein